jgi:hypothetical protein
VVVFADAANQSCSSVDDSLKSSKLTLWQSDERCIAVVDVRENERLNKLAQDIVWQRPDDRSKLAKNSEASSYDLRDVRNKRKTAVELQA